MKVKKIKKIFTFAHQNDHLTSPPWHFPVSFFHRNFMMNTPPRIQHFAFAILTFCLFAAMMSLAAPTTTFTPVSAEKLSVCQNRRQSNTPHPVPHSLMNLFRPPPPPPTTTTTKPKTKFSTTLATTGSSCAAKADVELTQGPFWIVHELIRQNLTDKAPGVPLELNIEVIDINTCAPLPGAAVELWNCNAEGLYSGFTGFDLDKEKGDRQTKVCVQKRPHSDFTKNGPVPEACLTDWLTEMRGIQFTDDSGVAKFHTIVPSFYAGRSPHHHFIVYEGGEVKRVNGIKQAPITSPAHYPGKVLYKPIAKHVGQLFYPDDVVMELYTKFSDVYPKGKDLTKMTRLADDKVWAYNTGGTGLIELSLQSTVEALLTDGVVAKVTIYVDTKQTVDLVHDFWLYTDEQVEGAPVLGRGN